MSSLTHTLSRQQVVETERRAWLTPGGDGSGEYFFDGINFWRHHGRAGAELIAPWRAPVAGWRPRAGCRCVACTPQAAA
jgi:hypothetical protein